MRRLPIQTTRQWEGSYVYPAITLTTTTFEIVLHMGSKLNLCWYIPSTWLMQDLQEKFCKAEQDCLGARCQAETSLSDDQQPEFRGLCDFYIIIFLNKLKLVEYIDVKKNNIKRLWLRIWDPSEIDRSLLGSPGPGPVYLRNPPLIGPGLMTFTWWTNSKSIYLEYAYFKSCRNPLECLLRNLISLQHGCY